MTPFFLRGRKIKMTGSVENHQSTRSKGLVVRTAIK
jgi:hypothetical protein